MGNSGQTFIDCWCVNMRSAHRMGDVFVMVCVCVTCMETYGCRTSCFERDRETICWFWTWWAFSSATQHTYTLSYTHTHRISILLYREPTSIPPPEGASYSYLSRSGMHGLRYIPNIHLISIWQPSIILFFTFLNRTLKSPRTQTKNPYKNLVTVSSAEIQYTIFFVFFYFLFCKNRNMINCQSFC